MGIFSFVYFVFCRILVLVFPKTFALRVARCYALGYGVKKSEDVAFHWLNKATELEDLIAQYFVGALQSNELQSSGKALATIQEEAYHVWWRIAATHDIVEAQFMYGFNLLNDDEKEGMMWLEKAAEGGVGEASIKLGDMYRHGLFVDQDLERAIEYWRQPAEDGMAGAQFRMGLAMAMGWGGTKDQEKMIFWFSKAAEQDHPQAQAEMGNVYAKGLVSGKGMEDAMELWKSSASQGNPQAELAIANAYLIGKGGVERSVEKAREWLESAASAPADHSVVPEAKMMLARLTLKEDWNGCLDLMMDVMDMGYLAGFIELGRLLMSAKSIEMEGNTEDRLCGLLGRICSEERWEVEGVSMEEDDLPQRGSTADNKHRSVAYAFVVGVCCLRGACIPQNAPQAVQMFQKGVSTNFVPSILGMGLCVENGYGVVCNLRTAEKLYLKCSHSGMKEANEALLRIRAKQSRSSLGPKCAWCGESGKLQRCSRCKKVWYCCEEHQRKDWKGGHKSICGSGSKETCATCGKPGASKACPVCGNAWYCSKACQKEDKKRHKRNCITKE